MKDAERIHRIVVSAICETQSLQADEIKATSRLIEDIECDAMDLIEIQMLIEGPMRNVDLFDDMEDEEMASMTVQQLIDWVAKHQKKKPKEEVTEEVTVVPHE